VVGTCNLPSSSYELVLRETLAYVANGSSMRVVGVADPTVPVDVGHLAGPTYGIDLVDTIVYVVGQSSLKSISVADPSAPYLIDSLPLSSITHDVRVVGAIAYVVGWKVHTVSAANPGSLVEVGSPWTPPTTYAHRVVYQAPYLYVACTDGGVCILDTLAVGIGKAGSGPTAQRVTIAPTVASSVVRVSNASPGSRVAMFDVTGREVADAKAVPGGSSEIDLTGMPDGVYLVVVGLSDGVLTVKVAKTRR